EVEGAATRAVSATMAIRRDSVRRATTRGDTALSRRRVWSVRSQIASTFASFIRSLPQGSRGRSGQFSTIASVLWTNDVDNGREVGLLPQSTLRGYSSLDRHSARSAGRPPRPLAK